MFIQGLLASVATSALMLAFVVPGGAPSRNLPLPGRYPKPPSFGRFLSRRFWLLQLLKEFMPVYRNPDDVAVPGATKICDGTHPWELAAPTKQTTQASCTATTACHLACQNNTGSAFGSTWNVGNFSRGLIVMAPHIDSVSDCGFAGRIAVHSVWGYCGTLPKALVPQLVPGTTGFSPNPGYWPTPALRPPGLPEPDVGPQPRPRPRPAAPGSPPPFFDPAPFTPSEPAPRPRPGPSPGARPRPRPGQPGVGYNPVPGVTPEPAPAPRPAPSPGPPIIMRPPGDHVPAPPGPGVKERKVFSPLMHGLLRFYHEAGEALDIVDCMYDSLPKQYKAKTPRYQNKKGQWVNGKITTTNKMKALYNGFDKPGYDMGGLTKCLIENEFEDQAIGRIMSGSSGAIQFIGRGLGWGPAV